MLTKVWKNRVLSSAVASVMVIGLSMPVAAAWPSLSGLTVQGPNGAQNTGTTLTYVAHANGNGGQPEFQWWEDTTAGWRVVQNYSTRNTLTIPDAQAGSYPVVVYALDANQIQAHQWGAAQHEQFIANVDSRVTLMASTLTPTAGAPVTLTATATHLLNPVYQFWYKTPSGQWIGSNYTANPTFTFTPAQTGRYTYVVYAKDPSAPNTAQFAVWHVGAVQSPLMAPPVADANAMPPTSFIRITNLTQNGQEISASHPVRAGQPMTITATISPVNWLDQQQIAFNVQFWVKPSPTSTWTPLPIAQTLEDQNQVQWTPPTSTGWAIGATLSPNATGPVIGQAVTTASLWDDWVQAQHHLANVLTPNTFRTYSVPYTAALTTLAQQYHFTQNTVIGQSTAVTTLTQQAQSLGLTLPSSVWAAGLTVATQDIPVYINNPALALKQMDWGLMPSAWQQTEVTNLMEGENIYTQMNDWRFLLQMTLESSVPSSAVIPAPSSSSLELLLSKTANGVVELNVPMQVVAWGYGPSTANASLLTTGQFAPMDVDLTLALVPDVAAPSGWGWIPVSYEG